MDRIYQKVTGETEVRCGDRRCSRNIVKIIAKLERILPKANIFILFGTDNSVISFGEDHTLTGCVANPQPIFFDLIRSEIAIFTAASGGTNIARPVCLGRDSLFGAAISIFDGMILKVHQDKRLQAYNQFNLAGHSSIVCQGNLSCSSQRVITICGKPIVAECTNRELMF